MVARLSHEWTPSRRGRVIGLRDAGKTYREIEEKTGVPPSSALRIVNHFTKYNTVYDLPRIGRPPIWTPRKERRIVRELKKDRFAPYKHTAAQLGGGLTERQVSYISLKVGYHRRVARRKPFLSKSTVQKRVQWARENQDRDWTKVIWTDEVSLELGGGRKAPRVTCRPGEDLLLETIVPTFSSGRKTLMLWGAISYSGKGPLVRLQLGEDTQGRRKHGGLNGERYVTQVMEGPLAGFVQELEEEYRSPVSVVEDGAPAHRSRVAQAARKRLGIKPLPHPPSSPDVSPIENVWHLFKSRINSVPGAHSSLDNLWSAARKVWDDMTDEDVQKFTRSMVARVAAVREARGFHTRY